MQEMSDKFNGFSQDEIEKICIAQFAKAAVPVAGTTKQAFRGHKGIRRMPAKNSDALQKQPPNTTNAKKTNAVEVVKSLPNDTVDGVNLDQSLSKSIEEALFYVPTKKTSKKITVKSDGVEAAKSSDANDSSILELPLDNVVTSSTSCMTDDSSILSDLKPSAGDSSLNIDSPFKGISLKDFESHRKLIEEQNKQKKQLLYKAIEHHSQKTAAEARKIEEIKSELSKLDNDLAVDVAILRKQIDNACVHFANIEKQYIKIESQFLKSKIELHNAAEKKELLTEHLCTVIAHNEDRKAQKLSELMLKVGISPADDYTPLPTSSNIEDVNDK